jgi:hypothetical protein
MEGALEEAKAALARSKDNILNTITGSGLCLQTTSPGIKST